MGHITSKLRLNRVTSFEFGAWSLSSESEATFLASGAVGRETKFVDGAETMEISSVRHCSSKIITKY